MKVAIIVFALVLVFATTLQANIGFKVVFPIGGVPSTKTRQVVDETSTGNAILTKSSSLLSAVIPGYYQLRQGRKLKGLGLLLVTGASISLGVAYRLSSDGWFA